MPLHMPSMLGGSVVEMTRVVVVGGCVVVVGGCEVVSGDVIHSLVIESNSSFDKQ